MKSIKIEIKWAIIFIITMLIWTIIERATGLHDENIKYHPIITNFVAIPAILIYVYALKEKKQIDLNGKITWLQGFLSGMIITIMVAVASPLMQYVTHKYVSPNYFKNVIDYSVKTGHMTFEDASKYFNLDSYMLQASFGALIMGVITSAIVSLFVRTKN